MSAMEHLVPEQMFSTETEKAQGISAVKALAIASQQGQKIWTIDKTNLELALSKITIGADAKTDIRNGVNAGKVVTAHEAQINFNGWVGEGYTLIDPNTGAGGYIISGGGNGGELFLGIATGLLQAFGLFFVANPIVAAFVGVAVLAMGLTYLFLGSSQQSMDFSVGRLLGIIAGFILTWIIGGFVLLSIPTLFLLGFIFLVLSVAATLLRLMIHDIFFSRLDSNKDQLNKRFFA